MNENIGKQIFNYYQSGCSELRSAASLVYGKPNAGSWGRLQVFRTRRRVGPSPPFWRMNTVFGSESSAADHGKHKNRAPAADVALLFRSLSFSPQDSRAIKPRGRRIEASVRAKDQKPPKWLQSYARLSARFEAERFIDLTFKAEDLARHKGV